MTNHSHKLGLVVKLQGCILAYTKKLMQIRYLSNNILTCKFYTRVTLQIYQINVLFWCLQLVKGWCETRRGRRAPSTCMRGMTPWSRAWCATSATTRWCGSAKIRSPGDGRFLPPVRAESLWTPEYRSCTMKVCNSSRL